MRLATLILLSMLLLPAPARGQTADEIDRLIAQLGSEDAKAVNRAADALGAIGPKAASAVPALTEALSDEHEAVRMGAAAALGRIGPKAAPAVPALTEALSDEDEWVRGSASLALDEIGSDLKKKGTVLWWVVPRVFWKEFTGLLFLLVAWFALMARFPKHRPPSTPGHLDLMAFATVLPVGLACEAVLYAITSPWAQGFLPDNLTLVPFPVAAVLSTALVVTLPAVWVCQRKSVAPEAKVSGA